MPLDKSMSALFGPPRSGKPAGGMPKPGAPAASDLPPDFEAAASEFMDDSMSAEERMAALKRAIVACVEDHEAGDYEEPETEPE